MSLRHYGGMKKFAHFVKTHVGAAIAAAACAVVLVGGVLLLVLLGGGSSSNASASTTTTTATTIAAPAAGKGRGTGTRRQGVHGQITSINGDVWTVTSAKGAVATVDLTPSTIFGTKAAPLRASDFSVGDAVVVVGTRDQSTVIATRVTMPRASAGSATTTTTLGVG